MIKYAYHNFKEGRKVNGGCLRRSLEYWRIQPVTTGNTVKDLKAALDAHLQGKTPAFKVNVYPYSEALAATKEGFLLWEPIDRTPLHIAALNNGTYYDAYDHIHNKQRIPSKIIAIEPVAKSSK